MQQGGAKFGPYEIVAPLGTDVTDYTNPNNYWRYLRGAMGGLSARTSTGRQATSGTH
ncbi:MAG: hypothetical protein HY287_11125 [Planctomycetes bacterium]|nr:hypothetical protein [Planctomycetota bacterium]MBI3834870.1 hypothetical protein [Planctomycetota bacterium]